MQSEQLETTVKRVRGSVKEAIGKVTGNKKAQLEGAAERKPKGPHRRLHAARFSRRDGSKK
jgi:uncharacterized protein YjbJ (UPF0337 family)